MARLFFYLVDTQAVPVGSGMDSNHELDRFFDVSQLIDSTKLYKSSKASKAGTRYKIGTNYFLNEIGMERCRSIFHSISTAG